MTGIQLYELRLSLSLSRKQMANYMGVHAVTYSQWEREIRKMTAASEHLIGLLIQVRLVCPVIHNILIEQAINGKS